MLNLPLDIIFPEVPNDIDINELDIDNLPTHVSIIMDGNGRWAKLRGKKRLFGHNAGRNSLREVVRCSSDLGIKYLSCYSFSTENWARPKEEVAGLMELFAKSILAEMDELHKNNVKIKILGDISRFPQKTQDAFNKAVEMMKNNTGIVLMPAVNYGSRDEILRAVGAYAKDHSEQPSEEEFSKYLYTDNIPDPDLLIRTSGEMRISNYLLWQIAYSELYVTDTLWPDFDSTELDKAITAYLTRNRRFGGV